MDWLSVGLWVGVAMVMLFAARYGLVLLTLHRLRLAPAAPAVHIDITEVPASHAELLALAAPRLEALGFTLQYASRGQAMLVTNQPCPSYSTTWWQAEHGVWAVVSLDEQPEYDRLYHVAFYSFYAAPPHLYSVACHAHELVAVHPQFSLADSGADLAHQWQMHLERMATRSADRLITEHDKVADIERRLAAETRAALGDTDDFTVHADGTAQLTWRGAWRYMRRYLAGIQALHQHPLAAADANGIAATEPQARRLRAQADVIAIRTALAAAQVDTSYRAKGLLLLITGIASLLLFGWRFDWLFSVVLVAVLLLHELGHLAAMRWAGYRDLKIFFIPFIGAMVSGREQQATAGQKMLVLLAGPVPGIVLGCALLHGYASQWWPPLSWLPAAASLLMVVNVFNLLPLVPLDGGRFFDLLLMARLPRWRGVFAACSALGMLAAGLWFEAPLMIGLGSVLLLGVPSALREARLVAALRRVHREGYDSDGAWLTALTGLLLDAPYAALPYGRRQLLARSITASSLAPAPSLTTVAAGICLYVFALALPVWTFAQHGVDILGTIGMGAVSATLPPSQADIDANLEAHIAAAADDAARAALVLRAASAAEDAEDYPRAHALYQRALALVGEGANAQTQRVEATLGMARNAEEPATIKPMGERLLTTLNASDNATRLLRARVLSAMSQDFTPAGRPSDIARLSEVVAIRTELLPADDFGVLDARQSLAWQLWQDDQAAEAVVQLRARFEAVMAACPPDCAPDQAWLRSQAYLDYGWLLLALGKRADATRLVNDYAARISATTPADFAKDERVAVLHGWIRDAGGDHTGAAAGLSSLIARQADSHATFTDLQGLIDLAIFSERGGDELAAARWRERLQARVAALRQRNPALNLAWLQHARSAPYAWQRIRLDAELAWLAQREPALLEAAP